jgi:hypothetical protein
MSRYKTCEAVDCDRIARKQVKLYLQEDEDRIGGWANRDPSNPKLFHTAKGWAVPKEIKFLKARVCDKCYEEAGPEDFCYLESRNSSKEKVISRVVKV